MADNIRIQVGVSSSVRAGMDGVVADINRSKGEIEKVGGDSGRGFAEAFGKVLRGDISGAVEDMQRRMGAGMGGIAAKATVWGAGIATALVAGWKAGGKIDEMLGISDKLGAMLARKFGTQEDEGLKANLERLKQLNRERWTAEEDEKKRAAERAARAKQEAAWQDEAIERDRRQRIAAIEEVEQAKEDARIDDQQGAVADMNREANFADAQREVEAAEQQRNLAFDPRARRAAEANERQLARESARRSRLERMAGIVSPEDAENMTAAQIDAARRSGARARQNNPMLRRIWEADQARIAAANAQQNVDEQRRRAEQAQIQAAVDQAETAKNTRELKQLKALLAMKGNN